MEKHTQEIYKLIFLLVFLQMFTQKCVIYQDSPASKTRAAKTAEEQEPQIFDDNETDVCPNYYKKPVCCNKSSRLILQANLGKLLGISDCISCINNIKRFMFSNKLRDDL